MDNRPYIVCDNLVKIYKVEELEVVALQGLLSALDWVLRSVTCSYLTFKLATD